MQGVREVVIELRIEAEYLELREQKAFNVSKDSLEENDLKKKKKKERILFNKIILIFLIAPLTSRTFEV